MRINYKDYISPGALVAPDADPDDVLRNMGYSKNPKGGYDICQEKLTDYLFTCTIIIDCYSSKYIYNFSTGCYEEVSKEKLAGIHRCIMSQLSHREISLWYSGTERMIEAWSASWEMNVEQKLNSQNFLVFKNCSNNLSNFEAVPHNQNQLSTRSLEYEYDPDAKCPLFLDFVNVVTCGKRDLAILLQEIIGNLLVSHNKAEKAFIFIGSGRNGKSTMEAVIEGIIGPENVSSTPLKILGENFGCEDLVNKQVNITTESDKDEPINTSIWKAITSNDPVSVNPKGKKRFTTKLDIKIVSFLNYFPSFSEMGPAVIRRLLVFPFDAVIPPDKVDPNLAEKLLSEKAGIMNWAIEGTKRLAANKWVFSKSKTAEALLNKMIVEQDSIARFISQKIDISTSSKSIKLSFFHDKYNAWAVHNSEKVIRRGFNTQFCEKLNSLHIPYTKVNTHGADAIKGIEIKTSQSNLNFAE